MWECGRRIGIYMRWSMGWKDITIRVCYCCQVYNVWGKCQMDGQDGGTITTKTGMLTKRTLLQLIHWQRGHRSWREGRCQYCVVNHRCIRSRRAINSWHYLKIINLHLLDFLFCSQDHVSQPQGFLFYQPSLSEIDNEPSTSYLTLFFTMVSKWLLFGGLLIGCVCVLLCGRDIIWGSYINNNCTVFTNR